MRGLLLGLTLALPLGCSTIWPFEPAQGDSVADGARAEQGPDAALPAGDSVSPGEGGVSWADSRPQDLAVDLPGTFQTCLSDAECPSQRSCLHFLGWPEGLSSCFMRCGSHQDCEVLGPGSICAVGGGFCTLPCDPLTQLGCHSGTQCTIYYVPSGAAMIAGTNCEALGSVEAGDPCQNNLSCQGGLICVNGQCRLACDRGAPACPTGESCQALDQSWVIGQVEYGACL